VKSDESIKLRYQRKLERLRERVLMEDFIFEELYECKRVFKLQLRVCVNARETQHLQAYIAHHCNPYQTGEDPYKGGLMKRIDVDQEEIEGKAMLMTKKLGVVDLPLGGGKSGILLKSNFSYTRKDHAAINKAFVEEADKARAIGPRVYSLASDEGTNEDDCDDIMKEYITLHETEFGSKRGVSTGKSIQNFGNPARKKATGRGGLIVARKLVSLFGIKKENMTVAIEGFGNVGNPTFELAEQYGFKPIAVSDVNGGIYNPNGLNISEVSAYYRDNKTFVGYKEADNITRDELLFLPCDILVPAATKNRLNAKTAPHIRAGYILELANGPTTEEGEQILSDRNIIIFPDILANAGGVVVSWIELNINKEHDRHSVELSGEEEETNRRLEQIMLYNTDLVFRIAVQKHMSLGDAASFLSLSRIVPRLQRKHILHL